jgi:hypothetical protein
MRKLYVIWFEDIVGNRESLMYNLEPTLTKMGFEFVIDPHESATHITTVSQSINIDLLLVDYNLKSTGGKAFEGDAIISSLVAYDHNKNTPIVFHSSNFPPSELQKLVPNLPNIICVHRDDLEGTIVNILAKL